MSILDEVNHRPESRMRETRQSGSEGGGAEINRLSLPLWYAWQCVNLASASLVSADRSWAE
jgi:hypothetical protein